MSTPVTPIHIALLDDQPLFRQGLRYILEPLPYVASVTETAEVATLVALCHQHLPDLVLLDWQMPDMDGAAVAPQLLSEFPKLKIIVLSMFAADECITQMMKLGARSYLPKDTTQQELVQAIEEVVTTGYHFTPRISQALMWSVQASGQQPAPELQKPIEFTAREEEVLRLICEGLTAAAIAAQLLISRRTVEGHRQSLLEKTKVSNVASLVVYAARHGMITI